ncbi:MAG: LuxR C-terminal-related transcriptional regulator [Deltaproteobacteria bacterium]
MSGPSIMVAIVDRERVFVDALVYRLENETGIRVACTAEDGAEEIAPLIDSRPEVVILGAELPQGRAFDIAAGIRRQLPPARIVFLMQSVSDALIEQALRVKADGILSRDEPLVQLVQAVRRAAAGEPTFSRSVAARLEFDPLRGELHLRVDPPMRGLTDRQLEILRHLARGDSVKAVAQKLFLSPKSVDNQKFRIMSKIGVRDKVALALFAVREGLIQP